MSALDRPTLYPPVEGRADSIDDCGGIERDRPALVVCVHNESWNDASIIHRFDCQYRLAILHRDADLMITPARVRRHATEDDEVVALAYLLGQLAVGSTDP